MPAALSTVSTAYLEFPGAGSSSEGPPITEPTQNVKVWVSDNNLTFNPATHLTGFNWTVSSTWGTTATRQTSSIVTELNAILSNGTYNPLNGVTIGVFVQSQTPNAFGSGYRWFQDTPSVPITNDAFLIWQ